MMRYRMFWVPEFSIHTAPWRARCGSRLGGIRLESASGPEIRAGIRPAPPPGAAKEVYHAAASSKLPL